MCHRVLKLCPSLWAIGSAVEKSLRMALCPTFSFMCAPCALRKQGEGELLSGKGGWLGSTGHVHTYLEVGT